MGSLLSSIKAKLANKYQGVAPQNVINAVQKASSRTGVDFAFLMEKASAESNFNPTAKSKSSSATGLYQFIEDTWLSVVKKHGDKFGLSEYADQIEVKNGRCCVEDDAMKKKILGLRTDPEISALMAGAFTAENKQYLQKNTEGDVGTTEMYLAHFMGAGGATKFINCRDYDGNAIAARLFPQQARANKSIFYDRATGKPRTLDQVYNLFDKKFTGGALDPSTPTRTAKAASTPALHASAPAKAPAAAPSSTPSLSAAAQALPIFDDGNTKDDIIWSDDPRFHHNRNTTGFSRRSNNVHRITPENILLMSQMQENNRVFGGPKDKYGYNS